MRQEEAREICLDCSVFKQEFYCSIQQAEYRAIPWDAPTCPYKKWRIAKVLPKDGEPAAPPPTQPAGTTLPDSEMKIMTLLVGDIVTNITTIDEIVRSYKNDLETLEANPKGCTNCAKGRLLRQYIKSLRPVIHLWKQP